MLRLSILFLAVLWLAVPSVADPGPMLVGTAEGVALLDQGRDQMLAFRLDDAEATFARLAEQPGGALAAHFHLAKIALWKAMILEQEALYDRFFERNDAVLERIEAAGASPWATQFRAEAEFQRAIIHAKKTDYTRAALALRQAFNHYERNIEDHPDFYESYAGMGLCHVAVGLVPKSFRWVLRLLGFNGTVAQGMDEMEVAAKRSRYYQEEAAAYFALTDQVVNESREDGLRYLAALNRQHPESPVVSYVYGVGLLNERRASEAEAILRRGQRQLDMPGTFTMPYVTYFLADALFAQNEFEEAARTFRRFIDTFPGEALVAQANLHAGLALEMSGRRAEALPFYERIRVRDDYDSDAAAQMEAEARLAAPMTEHERALLLGRNAFDAGHYREAVATLQPVLGDQDAPAEQRAEAAYRSGRAYHVLEEGREALRHYQFGVDNPGDPLARWGPWGQFYIGEVHEMQGDREAARTAYRRALDYDDAFAYHKALEQRAKAALARL